MSTPARSYNEEELLVLLKRKDREAFNYLYSNYSSALYGVIKKVVIAEETSSDVLQEAFVKIWNNIASYDPSKARLYTWMLNICRNTAIDKLRSKGEVMNSKILKGEDIVTRVSEEVSVQYGVDAIGIREKVAELKPEYSTIVAMAYFGGFTMEEIAEQLKIPLGTVKTRMRAALQQLRKIYEIQ